MYASDKSADTCGIKLICSQVTGLDWPKHYLTYQSPTVTDKPTAATMTTGTITRTTRPMLLEDWQIPSGLFGRSGGVEPSFLVMFLAAVRSTLQVLTSDR